MAPLVGLIMGSDSDWDTVAPAAEALAGFGIPFEVGVLSAHRTPERMLAMSVASRSSLPAPVVPPTCPAWSPPPPRCRSSASPGR